MLQMSRKCVPYTPVTMKLAEMSVALVSSTGVYLKDQEPFTENGDESYRVLPGELNVGDLRFKHGHYDTSEAMKDPNCVFPMERLRELAEAGIIRKVSNKHIGFKGFSTNLKAQYENLSPKIADEIERSQADAVLLTGGWPVCHRVIVAAQREIEAKGIPTVLITVVPEESRLMRPPRAVYPKGQQLGRVLGQAGEKEKQTRILVEALRQFETLHLPGEIVEFEP
jgi:D-proline reductase (dithiol) PrdB